MTVHQVFLASVMSVFLAPALAAGPASPSQPETQLRGAAQTAPVSRGSASAATAHPEATWVEGHSRGGIFVPGHWQ